MFQSGGWILRCYRVFSVVHMDSIKYKYTSRTIGKSFGTGFLREEK